MKYNKAALGDSWTLELLKAAEGWDGRGCGRGGGMSGANGVMSYETPE